MAAGAPNFADKTIWTGDNLDILRGMNSECVDLIYLDPPFNSNKDYAAPVGSQAAGAAFKDTWHLSDLDVAWMGLIAEEQPAVASLLATTGEAHGKGMQSYLTMMAVRLLEIRRVLKDAGSIYLHCDPVSSHYLKALMDSVFGRQQFRNEIVWCYPPKGNGPKFGFHRRHDTVLFYGKSATKGIFSRPYTELDDEQRAKFSSTDKDGRKYKEFKGKRTYLDTSRGRPVPDWWTDIAVAGQSRTQFLGYPTQKPLALLERIIAASSNPGDVVLDPFCGCATACVAADRLERQWIGIDISPKAVELVNMRLQQAMGSLFHHGYVTARTDIPQRTDIEKPKPYRQNKHVLFGQQEGLCGGCKVLFPFRNFTIDHIIPQSRGGTGHLDNLQLLCGACNSLKGDRPQEYLVAQLKLAYV